jgi:hypothetical protein
MPDTAIAIDTLVARWSDPASRPLFKSHLITTDDDGNVCYCVQGDVLHLAGWSDDRLLNVDQEDADRAVAELLGISRAHAVMLRRVNDSQDGCPEDVLRAPEKVIGAQAQRVLAFWRRLDAMSNEDWQKVVTAGDAAGDAAWDAAGDAAWDAARAAAGDAARDVAGDVAWDAARDAAWDAAWAINEIQGAALMKERGQAFFFLPMFGISDPSELDGEPEAA